jgi:phage shock protein PspC (stress-responsive transcriptional regulator)
MYRPKTGGLAGVCRAIGDYFDIDITPIRLIFIILIFTPFPIISIYLLMWILIPKQIDNG